LLYNTNNFTGPVDVDIEVNDTETYYIFIKALDKSFSRSMLVEWHEVAFVTEKLMAEFNVVLDQFDSLNN